MEVVGGTEYNGLSRLHALLGICPLPCKLHTGLHGFRARVHWKDHVVAEHLSDGFRISAEHAVVEGPRGQSELLRLSNERFDDLRMTMALFFKIELNMEAASNVNMAFILDSQL